MKQIIAILLLVLLMAPSVIQYLKHSDVQVHLSMEMEEIKDKDSKAEKKSKEYLSYSVTIPQLFLLTSTANIFYSLSIAAHPHMELQSPPPDFAC